MNKSGVFVLLLFSLAWIQIRAATTSQWKIEHSDVSPTSEGTGRFTALVSHAGMPQAIRLSADVPFTGLKESFVTDDKLAVIGTGENTDAVVVVDLVHQENIDWFYCYQPQRVWNNWIAY